MSEIIQHPLPTGFSLDAHKTAGNAHSGHNVAFGELNGIAVALKPFTGGDGRTLESRHNKAEHEKRMYQIVGKLGYHTLRPIEVIDEHGIAYLLTAYSPDLVPGTSFDMTRPIDDTSRGKPVSEVVSGISDVLGRLHADSITHGDAKLRNFAFHRQTGEGPFVVDLEGAQRHLSKQEKGAEYFDNALRNDLRSIGYNLSQNGLGSNMAESESKDVFSDLLLAPYLASVGSTWTIPKSTIDTAFYSYQAGMKQYQTIDSQYV